MSDAVTDRIAFRVETFVIEGVQQVSFSGFFKPESTLAERDALMDELIAVAERQRAKHLVLQLESDRAGKQRIVDQEEKRLSKILDDAEVQKENGGLQDSTKNALAAAQSNMDRRKEEVMVIDAKLEALKPMLREAAPTPGS